MARSRRFSAKDLRWFCGATGPVVVEQDVRWVDPTTDGERGLQPALTAAGLGLEDEVTARAAR